MSNIPPVHRPGTWTKTGPRAWAVAGLVAGAVLASGLGRADGPAKPDDREVARKLGLTEDQVRRLHQLRGLDAAALLAMRRPMLEEALEQIEEGPRPDYPGAAAKFHKIRAQVDAKGTIPPNALPRAIARVNAMRQQVPGLPKAANVVVHPMAVANPAMGAPYRVAGMPVGPLRRHHAATPSTAISIHPLTAGINPSGWTWLGPGNVGGRTRAIAVHPTQPSVIYAASVAGGIWKTADGGASWAPLDDFMTSLNVSCLLIDPTDPNTIYAGTGEGFYNIDAYRGAGIFKSTDAGATWTQLPSTTGPRFQYVNRLAMAKDGSVLLAAARSGDSSTRGISRSLDRGATFSSVASIEGNEILDVDIPDGASAWVAGGRNGRAFYSTDSGVTWTAAAGLPDVADIGGRVELAHAARSPDVIYASVDNNLGELYRSTDSGKTYARVNAGTNYLGNQGWYANAVWAGDPTDANLVVVGGLDLYRSADGGSTFTRISSWSKMPASPHADHHTIVAHAGYDGRQNRVVLFGNDGGIYASTDVRASVDTTGWQVLNNSYGVTQFFGAAGNASSGRIVGGAQDNGTIRYTPPPGAGTGTQGYTTMYGGDGGFCASDPTDPSFFYGEYVYLQLKRSTDGGATAADISQGIGDAGDQDKANFIAPFILDPNNPDTMLAGGSSLWRSLNVKAATPAWTAIKPETGSPIGAVAVARGDSNTTWVGHNDGTVFKTPDGGTTWAQVGAGALPSGRACTRIVIDPSDAKRVYVTFGGYAAGNVWKTTDGGATYAGLGGSLPEAPAYALAIHPDHPTFLYLGTEVGVFATGDGGATWSPTNEGPTNCSVTELFWMNRKLVAATHGRGLFTIDLASVAAAP